MRSLFLIALFVVPLRAADDGPMLRSFPHDGFVRPVVFAPDGKTMATGSYDRKVRLWNVADGKKKQEWTLTHPLLALAYSPDGKYLAAGTHQGELTIFDVAAGKKLYSKTTDRGNISGISYAPDGKTLATADYEATISLWDATTGKKKRHFSGHPQRTWSVAFSPDGKLLVSGGDDAIVRLWDVASGKEVRQLAGHRGSVGGVAFSREGRFVASASTDMTFRVWEVLTGTEVRNLNGDTPHAVVFTPDGRHLLGATRENVVYVWSLAEGKRIAFLNAHQIWVLGIAVSPDGKLALSGSQDKTARLWKLESVIPAAKPTPLTAAERDKQWAALATEPGPAYQALHALASDPATLDLLEKALQPVPVLTPEERKKQLERVAGLLSDLGTDRGDQAMKELEKLGEEILPALRKAHDSAGTVEVLTQTAVLLDKLESRRAGPLHLREMRAVAILEGIGDKRSRKLLEKLAKGNPDAALTAEAKTGLQRLGR